ncbi:MAG: radical SAM protein [Lentisphaerae bacterium]|nr:radical SAM protein [Lentisphaerota bacterium]
MPEFQYLFGPVPSRRFGLSLGVDLVPRKTCSLDCVFCEVGPTTYQTRARREYVPTAAVLKELDAWFALNLKADFITVTGSGEPTLHTRFGDVLAAIRACGRIRSALLTNSSLLYLKEVQESAAKADVVKATLLAWDQASFAAITHAPPDQKFDQLLEGLQHLRQILPGELWLEVFLVPGLNTMPSQVEAMAALARTIRPDRIHLNTAVRPTAQRNVLPLAEAQLRSFCGFFSPPAEVIARYAPSGGHLPLADKTTVLAMLARRPCTELDVAQAFALSQEQADDLVRQLLAEGRVRAEERQGETYYYGVS